MPRSKKLKVYRTPIGFHDAYVAASSQKAALKAWGSNANHFARGVAEVVSDEALTKEPLANPGKVVRRLRGTAAEQLAALPPNPPPSNRAPVHPDTSYPKIQENVGARKIPKAPARTKAPRSVPKPRPSRAKLDEAESRLDDLLKEQKAADEELRQRERLLASERRDLERSQQRERRDAERRVQVEHEAHLAALSQWRAGK